MRLHAGLVDLLGRELRRRGVPDPVLFRPTTTYDPQYLVGRRTESVTSPPAYLTGVTAVRASASQHLEVVGAHLERLAPLDFSDDAGVTVSVEELQ